MANTNVPWDQRPWFLTACNRTIQPGGQTAYTVARKVGATPTDVTDFHPGQDWDELNLPEVMFMLRPDAAWHTFKGSGRPPQKVDSFGQAMFERYPEPGKEAQPLLDFAILPDKIGTEEQWWFLEAVRRLDPRIRWSDIIMRMEWVGRRQSLGQTFQNSGLNTDCYRGRERFTMVSWFPKRQSANGSKIENEVLGRLTQAQILANTTRGSTPGLINPQLGEAPGNRVALPQRGTLYGLRTGPRRIRRRAGGNNVAPAAANPVPAQQPVQTSGRASHTASQAKFASAASSSIATVANMLPPPNRATPSAAIYPPERTQANSDSGDGESYHGIRQPRHWGPEEAFQTTSGARGMSWSPAVYGYGEAPVAYGYEQPTGYPYRYQCQTGPMATNPYFPQANPYLPTPPNSNFPQTTSSSAVPFTQRTQPQNQHRGYDLQAPNPASQQGFSSQYSSTPNFGFRAPSIPDPSTISQHQAYHPPYSSDSFVTGSLGSVDLVEQPSVEQSQPQYSQQGLPSAAAFEAALERDSLNWAARRKAQDGRSDKEHDDRDDSDEDSFAMPAPRRVEEDLAGQNSVESQRARRTQAPYAPYPELRSRDRARSVRSNAASNIFIRNKELRELQEQQERSRLSRQRRGQGRRPGVNPRSLSATTSTSGSGTQGRNQTKRKRPDRDDLEVAQDDNTRNEQRPAKRRNFGQTTDDYRLDNAPGFSLQSQPSQSFGGEQNSSHTKKRRRDDSGFDTGSDQDDHLEQPPSKRRNTTGVVDSSFSHLSAARPLASIRRPSARFSRSPNPISLPQDSFGNQDKTTHRAKDVTDAPEDPDSLPSTHRVEQQPAPREDEPNLSNGPESSESPFQPSALTLTQEEIEALEFDFEPWLVDGAFSSEPLPPPSQAQPADQTLTKQQIGAQNREIDQYLDSAGVPAGPTVPDYGCQRTAAQDLTRANVTLYEDLSREGPHHGIRNTLEDGGHGAVIDPSIVDPTYPPRHASSNLGGIGVGPAVRGLFNSDFDQRWYVGEKDGDNTSFSNMANNMGYQDQ